ncbi:hypothetical protein LP420_26895 [Massilia sp. B-10]|nr:hypothetical protein LP420_26895 [Massilia sp. B-10]
MIPENLNAIEWIIWWLRAQDRGPETGQHRGRLVPPDRRADGQDPCAAEHHAGEAMRCAASAPSLWASRRWNWTCAPRMARSRSKRRA